MCLSARMSNQGQALAVSRNLKVLICHHCSHGGWASTASRSLQVPTSLLNQCPWGRASATNHNLQVPIRLYRVTVTKVELLQWATVRKCSWAELNTEFEWCLSDLSWRQGHVQWTMKHPPCTCKAWSSKWFFDVVMNVLMFIQLASGVEYPKMTTVGFVLKRAFVDVLLSYRFYLFVLFWPFWHQRRKGREERHQRE